MPKTIEAVYEEGVFKPLQKLDIKEHEKVELRILFKDQWHSTFTRLIEKIQKKSAQYSSREIETDIAQAVKETRKEKNGC